VQYHRLLWVQALSGFTHLGVHGLARGQVVALLPACGGLAALLLTVEQDLRLVAVPGLVAGSGLVAFEALVLTLQVAGLALAFELQTLEIALGQFGVAGLASGECAVVAPVAVQARGRQLDDALHAGEQRAVVADDQQPLVPAFEHDHQGGAAGGVQVVGGLVENQVVGVAEKRTQQCHAHGLAAAQRFGGAIPAQHAELLAGQVAVQLLAYVPAFADSLEVARGGTASLDALERFYHLAYLGQVGDRGAGGDRLLSEVVHATLAQAAAIAGLELTGHQACEYGFAHAVAPHQAGAALVETFGEVGKQQPAVWQCIGDAVQRQG